MPTAISAPAGVWKPRSASVPPGRRWVATVGREAQAGPQAELAQDEARDGERSGAGRARDARDDQRQRERAEEPDDCDATAPDVVAGHGSGRPDAERPGVYAGPGTSHEPVCGIPRGIPREGGGGTADEFVSGTPRGIPRRGRRDGHGGRERGPADAVPPAAGRELPRVGVPARPRRVRGARRLHPSVVDPGRGRLVAEFRLPVPQRFAGSSRRRAVPPRKRAIASSSSGSSFASASERRIGNQGSSLPHSTRPRYVLVFMNATRFGSM